ncbi:hypothetical protein [Buttiauxella sp. WJP83]|uniref:hypothetical protein n=1 Tax=Buttiauxella sp. WJP83 TaxID=2986951 RepID=UPI003FA415A2
MTDDSDESEGYGVRVNFTEPNGTPYAFKKYNVRFSDNTEKEGFTDEQGHTEWFTKKDAESIDVTLISNDFKENWGTEK